MRFNISLEDAHNILLSHSTPVEENSIFINEALGKILSRDISAHGNLPPFEKSSMDGYALRSADIAKALPTNPVALFVVDETRAGFIPEKQVTTRTAVRVMTGAAIPQGADTVVRSEDVSAIGNKIKVCKPIDAGTNLVKAGEDISAGELIAPKGIPVSPSLIGLLAGLGMIQIPVRREVCVAVMSTGDELIDPSAKPRPGKIFNSSLYGIMAQCQAAGAKPISLGVVPDKAMVVAQKMSEGLKKADIVITTGGTSAGDYDVVEEAMMLTGAKILFNGVAVKSGSPVLAGKRNGKFIISLSGNPSGAAATFDLIVMVLLNKLMGFAKPLPSRIEAVMTEGYLRRSPVRRLLRAKISRQAGTDYVELTDHHSKGMIESIMDSNFFIDIPAGSGYIHPGELVWGFPAGDLNRMYSQITEQAPAGFSHQMQHRQHYGFYRTA